MVKILCNKTRASFPNLLYRSTRNIQTIRMHFFYFPVDLIVFPVGADDILSVSFTGPDYFSGDIRDYFVLFRGLKSLHSRRVQLFLLLLDPSQLPMNGLLEFEILRVC